MDNRWCVLRDEAIFDCDLVKESPLRPCVETNEVKTRIRHWCTHDAIVRACCHLRSPAPIQCSVKGLSRLTVKIKVHNLNLSFHILSLVYQNICKTLMLLGNYNIPQSFIARLQVPKSRVQSPISHLFGQNYRRIDFSFRTSVSPGSYLHYTNDNVVEGQWTH